MMWSRVPALGVRVCVCTKHAWQAGCQGARGQGAVHEQGQPDHYRRTTVDHRWPARDGTREPAGAYLTLFLLRFPPFKESGQTARAPCARTCCPTACLTAAPRVGYDGLRRQLTVAPSWWWCRGGFDMVTCCDACGRPSMLSSARSSKPNSTSLSALNR